MKKAISAILAVVLLFSLSVCAFAANDLPNLELPKELKDIIKKTDSEELALKIRLKLDTLSDMNDKELYEFCREFCDTYSIEITDTTLKTLVSYIKYMRDFDTEQIKETLEDIKSTFGILHQIGQFVSGFVVRAKDVIVILSNAISSFVTTLSEMAG